MNTFMSDPRTLAIAGILLDRLPEPARSVLVVGCGSGREAAVLAHALQADVRGIDLVDQFDPEASKHARLERGDATAISYADESFDVVYSYHALEHIPESGRALREMRRVLRPGGTYCIGTPNRARLLGYIGGGSTLREKLRWNLADWRARLTGRFRNEYGAHAGFTSAELRNLLSENFSTASDVSTEYYRRLYSRHQVLLGVICAPGLRQLAFPSVYFVGER